MRAYGIETGVLSHNIALATTSDGTLVFRSFRPRKLPAERTGHSIYMEMEQEAIIRTDWEATDDEAILISLVELLLELHVEDEQVACNG